MKNLNDFTDELQKLLDKKMPKVKEYGYSIKLEICARKSSNWCAPVFHITANWRHQEATIYYSAVELSEVMIINDESSNMTLHQYSQVIVGIIAQQLLTKKYYNSFTVPLNEFISNT